MSKSRVVLISAVALLIVVSNVQSECNPPFVKLTTGCYFFSDQKLSWWDAVESCRQHDSILTTVESPQEDTVLRMHTRKLGKTFWLGATDMVQEGKWIWESNQRSVLYTAWGPNQPSNDNGKQHCLTILYDSHHKWNDDICESKYNYICRKNEDSVLVGPPEVNCHCDSIQAGSICPAPFTPWLSGCLYYSNGFTANWSDSASYCQALGGHLLEIHTEIEWLQLKVFLHDSKYSHSTDDVGVWLGASDAHEEGSWTWLGSGKRVFVTSFWGLNQPDDANNTEDCLTFGLLTQLWSDSPCFASRSFICQAKPTKRL